MSDTKALPNAALLSHSNDKHNLPPLSTAPLSHSGSKHPTGYSDLPPSYSPSHLRESNSPPKLSQRYSYLSSSLYLLMPTLLVYNPVLLSKCLPLYSNNNSPLHSSPHLEPTTVDPSYLLLGHNSVYPYSMTPASAAMMSQLPLTIVPSSNLLPQPLTPVCYKTKPVPKRRKKIANLMRNTVHDGHGQWDPWLPSVCLLPVLQSYGCKVPLPVTL
ncbi:Zinc finger protein [Rhizoctonia solani]|uniref:Zinc finger protein n=1 Tax=Rhizoctonia solani TaxID=456999 RepID=A0A8H8NVI9_9AGAM|nr:Zinc finger protein [Rhizoctonia solani]QRW20689.1 Zinc finger protein [Rhizoctonia solani]